MDNNNGGNDSYTKAVAVVLRHLYEESGKTYQELADKTGLSRPTIERVINGKREVNARYLNLLCPEFGTTPGAVLNEADNS